MTLVLATSVVVLGALGFVLIKMIPLERPEVFFLSTHTRSVNTIIEPLDLDDAPAFEKYEKGFIREYVIARNTLYENASVTRKNWTNVIKSWSSKNVYTAFTKTNLYKEYILNDTMPTMSCSVNFSGREPLLKTASGSKYTEYVVDFAWVCKNSGGQTTTDYYKIQLRIKSVLDTTGSNMAENLNKLQNNPLGIQVVSYMVLDGNGDPLNSNTDSL